MEHSRNLKYLFIYLNLEYLESDQKGKEHQGRTGSRRQVTVEERARQFDL
jgi:hypothetical protein